MKRKNTIFNHDQGQGMVEYALLIGLIALVSVAAVTLLFGKTGSATCTKVEDSSSVFTMYEYNKNNDTGIKAIYENVVCILGGWENENIISNVDIKIQGPKRNGVMPIASEINVEDKNYNVTGIEWSWVDENGKYQETDFIERHPEKNPNWGTNRKHYQFDHVNFPNNERGNYTYVSKMELEAKGDYQFQINAPIDLEVSNTRDYGSTVRKIDQKIIENSDNRKMEVIVYYDLMPYLPPKNN